MRSGNSISTLTLTPMTKAQAGQLVKRLLGSYPSVNLHDPETYVAAVVSLLTGYPYWAGETVVRKITASTQFVPTLAEIRPALEEQVKVARYAAEWDRGAEQQLLPAPPRPPKPTMEELKAKYGPNWGISNPDKARRPKPLSPDELCAKYGVSREDFDALPNAKDYGKWQKLNLPEPESEAAE